jgi:hypothetical protein
MRPFKEPNAIRLKTQDSKLPVKKTLDLREKLQRSIFLDIVKNTLIDSSNVFTAFLNSRVNYVEWYFQNNQFRDIFLNLVGISVPTKADQTFPVKATRLGWCWCIFYFLWFSVIRANIIDNAASLADGPS